MPLGLEKTQDQWSPSSNEILNSKMGLPISVIFSGGGAIGPTIFSIFLLILACKAAILSIGVIDGDSTLTSFGGGKETLLA